MTLAELREAEAPPDIAAIYAALREASGVPLVNLIYRHLATLDGVLPWVWAAIRPPLEDGRLAAARDRLAAAVPLPVLAPLPATAWAAAGLDAADRTAIAALVEVYNRGNLTNLILLTALRQAVEAGATPGHPSAAAALPPPPMLPTPPPLPRLEDLPPATAAWVQDLAARHPGGVVPSLYLHLAHWPAVLAALPDWAAPLLATPALVAARDATVALAQREATALGLILPATRPPGPGSGPGLATLEAIGNFTRRVIPGMVPVGLGLRRILAQP